jgi:hypothetical protein
MSTEIATTTGSDLPAMPSGFSSSTDDVGLDDIKLPRIYLMQQLSEFVKDGSARSGDIVMAGDTDDVPVHLLDRKDGPDSFTAYVVNRRKFAATTAGGGIEFHSDNKRDPQDPDSWEGWFFDIAVEGEQLPIRWMLWKTAGRPAAQAINTLIQRALGNGETDPVCIEVKTKSKTNKKGQEYFVPVIAKGTPSKEGLEKAYAVRELALALNASRRTENDAPSEGSSGPSIA